MRMCWTQWLLLATVILLGTMSLLAGCGKKGKLYLPEEPPAAQNEQPEQDTKKPKKTP